MHKRTFLLSAVLSIVLSLAVMPAILHGQDGTPKQLDSVAPLLVQPSMNVFRRFATDPKAMYEFYGKVLGLKQLTTFDVGGNTNVARFQAGASEFKLTGRVPNRRYQGGKVNEATGLRLLTLFFPNQEALIERFRSHNLPTPEFRPIPGSRRTTALVADPDGQWVELVVAPGEPAATYNQIEVGLTVSDLEASKAFYRSFVGLEELPSLEDPLFGGRKHPFHHGSTTITLRSFGGKLPADTGSGGIQYVVSDARAVEALAKTRGVVIAQPLSTMTSFALTTVWLDDPDGITNYFAQTAARGPRPAAK